MTNTHSTIPGIHSTLPDADPVEPPAEVPNPLAEASLAEILRAQRERLDLKKGVLATIADEEKELARRKAEVKAEITEIERLISYSTPRKKGVKKAATAPATKGK